MDFKIEKKPNFYVIERERGAYSDWEHVFDIVAANSPEEAWLFITTYWEDLYKKNKIEGKFSEYESVIKAEWQEKRMELEDAFFGSWTCKIYMLPVLHVHSL